MEMEVVDLVNPWQGVIVGQVREPKATLSQVHSYDDWNLHSVPSGRRGGVERN